MARCIASSHESAPRASSLGWPYSFVLRPHPLPTNQEGQPLPADPDTLLAAGLVLVALAVAIGKLVMWLGGPD